VLFLFTKTDVQSYLFFALAEQVGGLITSFFIRFDRK
jgi:hypothetical protein